MGQYGRRKEKCPLIHHQKPWGRREEAELAARRQWHQEQPYGYGRANSDTIVSYDALSVLLTAYQRLSQGQTLQVALKELTGDQAFQGVSGQISFGTDGNPLNKAVVLLSLRPDGDVQLASTSGIQGCFLINTCTNP